MARLADGHAATGNAAAPEVNLHHHQNSSLAFATIASQNYHAIIEFKPVQDASLLARFPVI